MKSVLSAGKRVPNNTIVHQYAGTKKNDRCDSCGVQLDKNTKRESRVTFEIQLDAQPSGGVFETQADVWLDSNDDSKITKVEINGEIGRVDRYGEQPACIQKRYPHLRRYCYCKDFIKVKP